MAKLPLHQGSYQARNVQANAQACVNLYPEPQTQDAVFPIAHYPAPGTYVYYDLSPLGGPVRGLYECSNGTVVAVIGVNVVSLQGNTGYTALGQLASNSGQPVSMCDNGATLVLVDGSPNGYMVGLGQLTTPGSLVEINDSAFYGSNRVDYIDTFLIFNYPGTGTFYTTTSGVVTPFDPTYAAAKEGWNDLLVAACCLHDNIWLLGNTTTEIWYNAGGTTFPFARMPNSILQQGCSAPSSPIVSDNALYWLSQDRWGHAMMMRGEGYQAKRISTFAVENAWSQYGSIFDCTGMSFQIGGHEYVGFLFPYGNAFWVYDASTQMWHQRTYGTSGDAWLPRCTAFSGTVFGVNTGNPLMLAGSRQNGQILAIDRNTYTDIGAPIERIRSWPHVSSDGNRNHHARFSASMNPVALTPEYVQLSWSDDGGNTYGSPVGQATGNNSYGQYQWRRLGYARDRVYQLQWNSAGETVLNGAWIDVIQQGT